MKKAIIFGLVLAGFAMASCKKNYTCNCTTISITSGPDGSTTNQSSSSSTIEATEKKAIEECEGKSTSSNSSSGFDFTSTTKACSLDL